MKKTFLKKLCLAFACATLSQPIFAHEGCENTTPPATPASQSVPIPPAQTTPPAGNALTVAELVRQTVLQNPELYFYENEILFAKDRSAVAERWADPELTVEIGRKSSRDADGSYAGDGLAWGVTLSQKFDFTGRNALRKAIAERQVDRAQAGLEQFRRELSAKTAELGYTLLAAQQRLDVAEEIAARGRALMKTLVQRDPAGVAALLETRVIEADIFKLEKSASVQRAALLTSLAELNALRGLPPETPLALANDTSVLLPAPDNAKLVGTALRDNFSLRQYEFDFQEQGLVVDLERKNGYGDVTIAPYYSEERAGSTDRTMGVGVTVPLPIFDANKAGIAEARTREGQAENALRKARRELHKNIAAAALDYRTNQELLADWGTEKIKNIRQAAELAERHYRMGSVPVSTYLALQQAYLDAAEIVTNTRSDAVKAAAQLTTLTGIPLEKFFGAPPVAADKIDHAHDSHEADEHAGHEHESPADSHAHEHDENERSKEKQNDHNDSDHEGHAHETPGGAQYSETEGIKLAPEIVSALGLKTAPATIRTVPENIAVIAQIVSENPPRAVASVSPAKAEKLKNAKSETASIRISDTNKSGGNVDIILTPKGDSFAGTGTKFVTCFFKTNPEAPVLTVPTGAILKAAEGTFVYRATESGYRRVPVKIGAGNDTDIAIFGDIKEGDSVVATAVEQLRLTELRLTKGGGHSH